jgi:hypothetical protein
MVLVNCPVCLNPKSGKPTGLVANAQTGAPVVCPKCDGNLMVEPPYQALFYANVLNIVLTALQQLPLSITILSRADFELVFVTGNSTGGYTLQIQDTSQRNWFSNPINNVNFVGTAQNQFPMGMVPVRMPATVVYDFTFTDTSNAGNTIQLCLCGNELFPIGAPAGMQPAALGV